MNFHCYCYGCPDDAVHPEAYVPETCPLSCKCEDCEWDCDDSFKQRSGKL